MVTSATTKHLCLVIDSNVLIALCSKETDKYAIAESEYARYSREGYEFYAPGVVIAETLYVLCQKLHSNKLSSSGHDDAIADLIMYMTTVEPPPNGDRSLIARAEEVRKGYGCSHSADGLYIALVEELNSRGVAELLTFDSNMRNQIKRNASSVTINLLVASKGG